MLNEVLAVAAVDPDLAQAGVGCGHLVEQVGAGCRVLDAGCGDQHREEEASVSVTMLRLRLHAREIVAHDPSAFHEAFQTVEPFATTHETRNALHGGPRSASFTGDHS